MSALLDVTQWDTEGESTKPLKPSPADRRQTLGKLETRFSSAGPANVLPCG